MSVKISRFFREVMVRSRAGMVLCAVFLGMSLVGEGRAQEKTEAEGEGEAEGAPLKLQKSVKDDGILARQRALDLAGAFSNDGYKMRDGFWFLSLPGNATKVLAVHLFAKNEYWFTGAAAYGGVPLRIEIFDGEGNPILTKSFAGDGVVATGCVPQTSGTYFVAVRATGENPVPFCLVYSYK